MASQVTQLRRAGSVGGWRIRIAALLVEYGWSIASGILSALGTFMISYLLHRKPIKQMRQELAELRRVDRPRWKLPQRFRATVIHQMTRCITPMPNAIVRAYIAPALQDMPDRVRLDVVHGFVELLRPNDSGAIASGRPVQPRAAMPVDRIQRGPIPTLSTATRCADGG